MTDSQENLSLEIDPAPDFQALVEHVLVQLADGLAHLENLLDANRAGFDSNDVAIVEHIRGYVDDKIRGPLTLHIENYSSALKSKSPDASLARTANQACILRSRLEDAHAALRHLDVPRSLPETASLVGRAWTILRGSRLGEISRLPRTPPAICLSHLLDPGEHILGSTSRVAGMSVVALAKADYASPRIWPLLLHEIGHRAIRELDINIETSDDVLRQWVIEIGCDIIGLRLIGPAYYSAFLSRVLVDADFLISTSRHPSPALRAEILLKHLPEWTPVAQRHSHQGLLRARKEAIPLNPLAHISPEMVICTACKSNTRKIVTSQVEQLQDALDSFTRILNESFNLPAYPKASYELANKLAAALTKGILVGGVRDTRFAVAELAKIDDDKRSPTIARSVADIAQSLCDQPADLFDILNAADIAFSTGSRRLKLLIDAAKGQLNGQKWREYLDLTKQQDELVVASMEISSFNEEIRGLAYYAG